MHRVVMHIGMNAFYASIAQHLESSLRGKSVAVVEGPEKRDGIILAKSRQVKEAGVKIGTAIWGARRLPEDNHSIT